MQAQTHTLMHLHWDNENGNEKEANEIQQERKRNKEDSSQLNVK